MARRSGFSNVADPALSLTLPPTLGACTEPGPGYWFATNPIVSLSARRTIALATVHALRTWIWRHDQGRTSPADS